MLGPCSVFEYSCLQAVANSATVLLLWVVSDEAASIELEPSSDHECFRSVGFFCLSNRQTGFQLGVGARAALSYV
jgi:hypothetical protein